MKHIKLLWQVILINCLVFILMGFFGYFLVIPAIERPYLEEGYTNLIYQLDEFMEGSLVGDRRIGYYYVSEDGITMTQATFENFEFRNQVLLDSLETLPIIEGTSGQGFFDLDIISDERISDVYFYAYNVQDGILYVSVTRGELHPLIGDRNLILQIANVAFIAFVLPVLAVLIWLLFISESIRSVQRQLTHPNDNPSPLLLSSELIKLHEGLVQYQHQIAHNEEQKQTLFQRISHELKTPISVIQSLAEGIEDGIIKDDQLKAALVTIQGQTSILHTMVNQIMDLNRLIYLEQHPELQKEISYTNISDVLFRLFDQYHKRYPKLVINAQLELMNYRGDSKTWDMIFNNIMENNIRHGATTLIFTFDNRHITIDNDGESIPETLLNQLFTPFVKGEKGTFGLGLTIIQKALFALDYDVKITNTPEGVRYLILDTRSL